MTQERIDAIVETILATKALQNSSWLAWGRNQLTRVGFRRSATSISRLFDDMPEQRHILLAGLDGAGKSTLLRNYFSQDCGRDVLSVGLDTGWWGVEEVSYANVSLYTLDLGCSRPPWYRRLERSIASEMDAVIWVLDASDHDRLCEAKEELQNVVLAGGGLKRAAPVLLLFNKRDLFSQNASQRQNYEQQFASTFGSRPWHMAETIVTTGDGLTDAFTWLSNHMQGRIDNVSEKAVETTELGGPRNSEKST